MAYFTGTLLERKVEEYDLSILDTKFAAIADGTDEGWPPGGYIVPASPTILEATRIVLYSMLHSYRLKSRFTVRIDYEESVIRVDEKAPTRSSAGLGYTSKKRASGVQLASSGYVGYRASLQDVPVVPEDLSDVFSEDLAFSPARKEDI